MVTELDIDKLQTLNVMSGVHNMVNKVENLLIICQHLKKKREENVANRVSK